MGQTPEDKFVHFDEAFTSVMDDILQAMGREERFPPTPTYKVVCNLLPQVRELSKQHLTWEAFLESQMRSRGYTEVTPKFAVELRKEVDEINRVASEYTDESLAVIQHDSSCLLKQKAFHKFWASRIHPKTSVSLSTFSDLLTLYMLSTAAASGNAQTTVEKLKAILAPEVEANDGLVDVYTLAKITRFAAPLETDIFEAISQVTERLTQNPVCLIPSFQSYAKDPYPSVYYNTGESEELTALLSGTDGGVVGVSGPSLVGKTHRLLHIVHTQLLSTPRDILWIDFARIDRESDGVARISSQLFLRNCRNTQELITALRAYLTKLRPGGLLIVDNISTQTLNSEMIARISPMKKSDPSSPRDISPRDGDDPILAWTKFVLKLLTCLWEFKDKLKLVIVASKLDTLRGVVSFSNEVVIKPLAPESAKAMIAAYTSNLQFRGGIPVDLPALELASCCLPGEIVLLAQSGSLGGIRKVAKVISEVVEYGSNPTVIEHAKSIVAIEIFNQLTPDEQLLSCCLFSNIAHFDEPLVWAMSKRAFHNDIVRWDIAWKGLLESGWVVANPDLGFAVSSIAAYVTTSCSGFSTQQLQEWYMDHWADEIARVNFASSSTTENPSAILEYLTQHMPHFKHLFSVVSNAKSKNIPAPVLSSSARALEAPIASSRDMSLLQRVFSRGPSFLTPRKPVTAKDSPRGAFSIFSPRSNKDKDTSKSSFSLNIFSPRDRLKPPRKSVTSVASSQPEPTNFLTPQKGAALASSSADVDTPTSAVPVIGIPGGVHSGDDRKSVFVFPEEYTCQVSELSEEQVTTHIEIGVTISPITLEAIVYKIAGKNGSVLNYHYQPNEAVKLASTFRDQLTPADGEVYEIACIEVSEQQLRNSSVVSAVEESFNVITRLGYLPGKAFSSRPLGCTARALMAYGRALLADGAFPAAAATFAAVLSESVRPSIPTNTLDKTLSEATKLLEEANSKPTGIASSTVHASFRSTPTK